MGNVLLYVRDFATSPELNSLIPLLAIAAWWLRPNPLYARLHVITQHGELRIEVGARNSVDNGEEDRQSDEPRCGKSKGKPDKSSKS